MFKIIAKRGGGGGLNPKYDNYRTFFFFYFDTLPNPIIGMSSGDIAMME